MDNLLLQEFMWNFSVAVIASAVGLAVTIISLTWSKHRDFSLVAFGATSFLYGLRLLADTVLSQLTTTAPPPALLFFTAFSTYVIPVPLSGFILQLVGRGWRNSILWALRGSIAFAAAGILSDLVHATPGSLMALNNVLVVLWACAVFANFFLEPAKQTGESKAVLIGFCVFGLFALNENLVELRVLPWEWRWEEPGFIVFLGTLAYGAAKRFFNNETRLLRMDREMEIARQIQSSILPLTLPVTDSLHVTARYVPISGLIRKSQNRW